MEYSAPHMDAHDSHAVLNAHLRALYGDHAGDSLERLERSIEEFRDRHPELADPVEERLNERDAVLITYGDQVRREGEAPLQTLRAFLSRRVRDSVNTVHLLPFYPYTSDDGFSVVDYLGVDPQLGEWSDVEALRDDYRLMFDAVINHVSASSAWFRGFLRDEAPYRDYFITEDPQTDLSSVVRPRTSPLLTPYETPSGTKHVWTTFSADQIDLAYDYPDVLLEITRVLLEYVARGAEILRLDAVTYLWKEVGTSCVHLPRTHRVLQLLRSVMNVVAPRVVLLTETNVPHRENISYFGNGENEAQMVYNFALPPLVLHAVASGDARALTSWARTLSTPSPTTCFFNFLASHDGIGVRPVEGILEDGQIRQLADRVQRHGGRVSYKTNGDGSQSPYELNISYFDALSDPNASEDLDRQIDRFMAAHAVILALAGVPGIYIHSLLGSRSDHEGVRRTGHNRSINRAKFQHEALELELEDHAGLRRRVLTRFRQLLAVRRITPAFHPQAPQEVLAGPAGCFAVRRTGRDGTSVVCVVELAGEPCHFPLEGAGTPAYTDLLRHAPSEDDRPDELAMRPYGVRWIATKL